MGLDQQIVTRFYIVSIENLGLNGFEVFIPSYGGIICLDKVIGIMNGGGTAPCTRIAKVQQPKGNENMANLT